MRTTLVILTVVTTTFMSVANGASIPIVSPNEYTNVEAPDTNGAFTRDVRVQSIHSSTVFASLPQGGATLTEISLRPDSALLVGEQIIFDRLQISLSVTIFSPLLFSDLFANNITGTPVVVYDGPWSATVVNEDPPGESARPFDFRIPLQTPYHYDPADGNFLVDWIMEPQLGITNEDFFEIDTADGNSDQQATSGDAYSVVSNGNRFAAITEFTFVPEPSSLALASPWAVPFAARRRRIT